MNASNNDHWVQGRGSGWAGQPLKVGRPPGPITRLIFTDFLRFFRLSWETSPQTDSTPEASKHSGSGRIEFSSQSTAFLMK